MTFVFDIDAGDEYFVSTASVRQRRAIERVGPSRHEASTSHANAELASTSHSYVEVPDDHTVDDHTIGEVPDVTKDDIEVSVPGTPIDPTLLTSYSTHVAALIWQHQVILLTMKIYTY